MHNFLFADPVDNMKDLLNQITSKEMSTAKRMGYVNNFTKVMYRSIICLSVQLRQKIDLLATDKTRCFAQTVPVTVNYLFFCFSFNSGEHTSPPRV